MSAINITTPVTQTMFAICILIGVGGSMLAGMAIGNHRRDEASGIFSMVATSAVVIGLIIGSLGMVFSIPSYPPSARIQLLWATPEIIFR